MPVRYERARTATLAAWACLLLALVSWLARSYPAPAAVGLLMVTAAPLILPLPGLWLGRRRTYRWAPLTLAPGLAWSLTEIVANPAAVGPAVLAGSLCIAALLAVVAALRTMPRGS